MNLAANARDAMPQGGHLSTATADVRLDDDYVHGKPAVIPKGHYALITVSDDGCGIPAEDLPHIFEPFYTTKPSGKGTGLGLAPVYGIVKQNKGFILVYSEPAEGTVFKIYLPCLDEEHRSVVPGQRDSKWTFGEARRSCWSRMKQRCAGNRRIPSAVRLQHHRSPGRTGCAIAGRRTQDHQSGCYRRRNASDQWRRTCPAIRPATARGEIPVRFGVCRKSDT